MKKKISNKGSIYKAFSVLNPTGGGSEQPHAVYGRSIETYHHPGTSILADGSERLPAPFKRSIETYHHPGTSLRAGGSEQLPAVFKRSIETYHHPGTTIHAGPYRPWRKGHHIKYTSLQEYELRRHLRKSHCLSNPYVQPNFS
jgi:hypothetical protein